MQLEHHVLAQHRLASVGLPASRSYRFPFPLPFRVEEPTRKVGVFHSGFFTHTDRCLSTTYANVIMGPGARSFIVVCMMLGRRTDIDHEEDAEYWKF